ncbi:hypothetical protein FB567DRAFT_572061 [Paraphoma chrysanthemicola]|uniref:Uncharacterized protein n=1 Tax=Paraphoma chrysanthemicola TaxID=798071 RepID=A0A8K0QYJ8_9PLEO|nr:hypothetical protein FB567DRAFT_572061 [Paraphoma chrysanthemicola]
MAGSGVNLAVTKDGGSYNKLQRPQDYLTASAPVPPLEDALPVETPESTSQFKRKREPTDGSSTSKRKRQVQDTSQLDSCGMRTTLPGLDDEDFASDDSTNDAMAYLRSVRSEASAIPNLLGGSTTIKRESYDYDEHVHFEEGTWIAIDAEGQQSSEEYANDLVPQDEYHQHLLRRYHRLRTMLATIDGLHNVSASEHDYTNIQPYYAQSENAWSTLIDRAPPNPRRLARTHERTVYRGLDYYTDLLADAEAISDRQSCWIWSLLGVVHDVGTLDNDKISRLRELGQQAGAMRERLKEASTKKVLKEDGHTARDQSAANESQVSSRSTPGQGESGVKSVFQGDADQSDASMSMSEDEDEPSDSPERDPLQLARDRLLAQLGDRLVHAKAPTPKSHKPIGAGVKSDGRRNGHAIPNSAEEDWADINTRVTVDMILTIVAECFGQRDLLEYRSRW